MPHLGPLELVIILVIVIIIFGVGKLPQIGGAIGQSIKEFRDASRRPEKEAEEEIKATKSTVARASRTVKKEAEAVVEEIVEEEEEEEEQA